MPDTFDTLFLLALPGSGKSEVRNYLTHRDPVQFHMGPTVQLDDYPYVHLQLVVDEILVKMGQPRVFHWSDTGNGRNGPFMDPLELGALCQLLNDDFDELVSGKADRPEKAARRLLERFDAASVRAGARPKFLAIPAAVRTRLEAELEPHARAFFDEKAASVPASLDGKTIVIEFARGGPNTGSFPLPEGYGYRDSLNQISPQIWKRSAILYIWVTPEESRRKNIERHAPDGDASILFHTTPATVMEQEYGTCDMSWMIETSPQPGTIRIHSQGHDFDVPIERFDNRKDLTSFLRAEPSEWKQEDIDAIHAKLKPACDALWDTWATRR